jgi:hypothetical protein
MGKWKLSVDKIYSNDIYTGTDKEEKTNNLAISLYLNNEFIEKMVLMQIIIL